MSILEGGNKFVTEYKAAEEFTKAQQDVYWTAHEIEVEKDLHDLHNTMTKAELHGVTTVLKLFTMYELEVGENYWGGFIMKKFPRLEVQAMASLFASVELAVHSPFYRKINEVMGLDTDEFYSSYVDDMVLKERMDWIQEQFDTDCPMMATAVGSIAEGAILYSNFAFLKHFQSEGKNKLTNLCAGINFSVRDENLHSLAGAWLYKTLKQESNLVTQELDLIEQRIYSVCDKVLEHESQIIDKIFDLGVIKGITEHQMKEFIKSRLNVCLSQLEIKPLYEVTYDPISLWFYKNINSSSLHDFFVKQGNNYNRNWVEGRFKW